MINMTYTDEKRNTMMDSSLTEQEISTPTNEDLYRRQMALLRQFLSTGAITQAQYDKSAGDLTRKMGFTPSVSSSAPLSVAPSAPPEIQV